MKGKNLRKFSECEELYALKGVFRFEEIRDNKFLQATVTSLCKGLQVLKWDPILNSVINDLKLHYRNIYIYRGVR